MSEIERQYYDNGQLKYEIPYQNNRRHGKGTWWNRDASLCYEKFWLFGKEVSQEEYEKYKLENCHA